MGIWRYSNITPNKEQTPITSLLRFYPAAGRILAYLLALELKTWHKRKKRPQWHRFCQKDVCEQIKMARHGQGMSRLLIMLEQNRWIRRRYRFLRGRRGCALYVRLVVPGELFLWEAKPGYVRKAGMPVPKYLFGKPTFETPKIVLPSEKEQHSKENDFKSP